MSEPNPVESIVFDARRRARVASAGASADDDLQALGIDRAGPVLLVSGGAASLNGLSEVTGQVIGRAVALAAKRASAMVIDGGTTAGVMQLVGVGRADSPPEYEVLLGVAPAALVQRPGAPGDGTAALEPHHTHFVLTPGDHWGSETSRLLEIAAAAAADHPVVVLVVGGGAITATEVDAAMARGWPVVRLAGSGGVADAVTAAPAGPVESVDVSEVDDLADVLSRRLLPDRTVESAWRRFAVFDSSANQLHSRFQWMQAGLLAIGVLATLAALLYDSSSRSPFHWTAVVLPILSSALVAITGFVAWGKRWIVMRAAAEQVKAEIYLYRTSSGDYRPDRPGRSQLLMQRIDVVENRLMQTEASSAPIGDQVGPVPPPKAVAVGDDGLSPLSVVDYIRVRVDDQSRFYRQGVRRLHRRRILLLSVAIGAGAAGAVLAAADLDVWIGLTTAISSAALAYLAVLQAENTIVAFNQAAVRLDQLSRAYSSSTAADPDDAAFVQACEAVMAGELGGWVQQMNDAVTRPRPGPDEANQADGGARRS